MRLNRTERRSIAHWSHMIGMDRVSERLHELVCAKSAARAGLHVAAHTGVFRLDAHYRVREHSLLYSGQITAAHRSDRGRHTLQPKRMQFRLYNLPLTTGWPCVHQLPLFLCMLQCKCLQKSLRHTWGCKEGCMHNSAAIQQIRSTASCHQLDVCMHDVVKASQ
eukprot:351375-Chlamydomonas_euryale.AAC.5